MHVNPPTQSDHSLTIGQLDATSLTGVDPVLSVSSSSSLTVVWYWCFLARSQQQSQSAHEVAITIREQVDHDGLPSTIIYHFMRTLLDLHAPMTSTQDVDIRRWQAASWYDEDCRVAKVSLRKLEKRHRRLQTSDSLNEWRCQSHVVRSLFQLKYSTHWSNAVRDCIKEIVWTKINDLLRRQTTLTSTLDVDDVLANYFRNKIVTIRQSTSGASRSNIEPTYIESFTDFEAVTVDEMIKWLHTLKHVKTA